MDLILGDRSVRKALEQGVDIDELERSWQDELQDFQKRCHAVLLYE